MPKLKVSTNRKIENIKKPKSVFVTKIQAEVGDILEFTVLLPEYDTVYVTVTNTRNGKSKRFSNAYIDRYTGDVMDTRELTAEEYERVLEKIRQQELKR